MISMALGEAHVGEPRGSYDVTGCPDARLACLHQLVDLHEAPIIDLDAATGRKQPVAEGSPADRDDDCLHLDLLRCPVAPDAVVDNGALFHPPRWGYVP